MAGTIVNNPVVQFFDNNGRPLSGGKITTYLSNTTTPASTWQNEGLSVLNTNPIVLNSQGEATIWLTPDVQYTFVLTDADNNLIQTVNDIYGGFQPVNGIDAASTVYTPAGTGAVATVQEEYNKRRIYPQDYMTAAQKMNVFLRLGTVDVIDAINKAVDYLVTLGGGELYFPPGLYGVSSHVKIRDKIDYQGAGWSSHVQALPSSLDNLMGDYGGGYDFDIFDVAIRDLRLDGNRANVSYNTFAGGDTDDAYQNGIRLQKCKRFMIERCYIHDTVFNAVSVYLLSNQTTVKDCYIKDVGKSTNVSSGFASYMGIFVEYAGDDIKIIDNIIDTTRDIGILVQTATDGGIRGVNIEGNIVKNCFANGIYIKDQAVGGVGPLENIVISKNIVTNCATGNTEPAIRTSRVSFGQRVYNITISDNIVKGNNFNGILVDTGTERAIVSGNVVTENLGRGITNAGTDVSVIGNVCVGNTTDEVDFSAATRASTIGNIDRFVGADGQQGTFTPTVLTGGAAVGRTYSAQQGSYRVNGNRVEFSLLVTLTAVGSSTGTLTIGGLPFTSKPTGPFTACAIVTSNISWSTVPAALIINNESQVRIFGQASGATATALTDVNLTATTTFYITGSYEI